MIEELETLLLLENLPEHGLERGAVGAAVLVYPDGSCEAEFVSECGETLALVTLQPSQFRHLGVAVPARSGRGGTVPPTDAAAVHLDEGVPEPRRGLSDGPESPEGTCETRRGRVCRIKGREGVYVIGRVLPGKVHVVPVGDPTSAGFDVKPTWIIL